MPQVENAGGHSSGDGKCISSLDVPILVHDQRTQVCFGSKGEVKRFEEYMYGEWRRGEGEWRRGLVAGLKVTHRSMCGKGNVTESE